MANTILKRQGVMDSALETELSSMHPLISWRSVVAGLLIAFFCMVGFLGLGMALGGIGLDEETSARSAGIFSGVWFLVSALLSIFIGSYFAARVSKFRTGRIGSAQGLVIAALFLGVFLWQTIMALGNAGQMTGVLLGRTAGMLGAGAERMAESPMMKNMVEDAVGDLQLRSNPRDVAGGLATRLLRGDGEGAKNFLVSQAGISQVEADQRIARLRSRIDEAVNNTKEGAATALRSAGWSLFFLVILGALSAIGGGALGSATNFRKPLARREGEFVPSHA